jgi:hypothetical protein
MSFAYKVPLCLLEIFVCIFLTFFFVIPRKLLDDLQKRKGYCHLKEEALDRTMWRAGFGRGFGPVVRQTTK